MLFQRRQRYANNNARRIQLDGVKCDASPIGWIDRKRLQRRRIDVQRRAGRQVDDGFRAAMALAVTAVVPAAGDPETRSNET